MVKHGKALGSWRAWCAAAVLSLLFVFGSTAPAWAVLYGSGDYSDCSYNSCPQPPQQTITTTPTGLQVAINLQNGQTIPKSGYTIMITPLNGKGSSFKQADIYINGAPAHTALPDETGTAEWRWIPNQTGKVSIKIIITDTNGATTIKEFTVNVKAQAAVQATQQVMAAPAQPKKTGIAAVLQTIGHSINKAVKALPSPVVHTFPYLLFVLLLGQVLLLGVQTTRELRELHAMRTLYERARAVDDAKNSFTELVSHYLRTPLTVILGGIDLLSIDKTLISSNVVDLKATAQRMRQKVESLIAQLQPTQESSNVVVKPIQIWRRPGLFVPVILIAVIWLVFEYLVAHVGTFSVSETQFLIQSAAFASVVVGLYAVLRYRQLHRRDKEELRQVMEKEQAVGRARDALIASSISVLSDELKRMDQLVAQLTISPTTEPIQNGKQRFHELLTKFAVASRLRGAQSDRPHASVPFSTLFAKALANVQSRATAKNMAVQLSSDVQINIQEPELLTYVLASLLDNSIAYSLEKSSVEVSARASADGSTIVVADHGSGVAPEKQPLLFQPFSKAEGAEVFTHEGMGFSLYLDRMIMTYLGGTIDLQSKPGRGTEVTLALPNEPQIIMPTEVDTDQGAVAGNVVTPTT